MNIPLSESFANWATGVGISAAAIGACWNWVFKEWLHSLNLPWTLNGEIKCEVVPHSDTHSILLVHSTWRNVGSRDLYIDIFFTNIIVFSRKYFPAEGPFNMTQMGPFSHVFFPHAGSIRSCYGKGAEYRCTASFVLPRGQSYGALTTVAQARKQKPILNWVGKRIDWWIGTSLAKTYKNLTPDQYVPGQSYKREGGLGWTRQTMVHIP